MSITLFHVFQPIFQYGFNLERTETSAAKRKLWGQQHRHNTTSILVSMKSGRLSANKVGYKKWRENIMENGMGPGKREGEKRWAQPIFISGIVDIILNDLNHSSPLLSVNVFFLFSFAQSQVAVESWTPHDVITMTGLEEEQHLLYSQRAPGRHHAALNPVYDYSIREIPWSTTPAVYDYSIREISRSTTPCVWLQHPRGTMKH